MKVLYDVRWASRIGRELCAAIREGRSEALVADGIGQPSSPEMQNVRGADAVRGAEGKTGERESQVLDWTSRGLRTWHVTDVFHTGIGRAPFRPFMVRVGKAMSRSR
jgi:hypothetical protein